MKRVDVPSGLSGISLLGIFPICDGRVHNILFRCWPRRRPSRMSVGRDEVLAERCASGGSHRPRVGCCGSSTSQAHARFSEVRSECECGDECEDEDECECGDECGYEYEDGCGDECEFYCGDECEC